MFGLSCPSDFRFWWIFSWLEAGPLCFVILDPWPNLLFFLLGIWGFYAPLVLLVGWKRSLCVGIPGTTLSYIRCWWFLFLFGWWRDLMCRHPWPDCSPSSPVFSVLHHSQSPTPDIKVKVSPNTDGDH